LIRCHETTRKTTHAEEVVEGGKKGRRRIQWANIYDIKITTENG